MVLSEGSSRLIISRGELPSSCIGSNRGMPPVLRVNTWPPNWFGEVPEGWATDVLSHELLTVPLGDPGKYPRFPLVDPERFGPLATLPIVSGTVVAPT